MIVFVSVFILFVFIMILVSLATNGGGKTYSQPHNNYTGTGRKSDSASDDTSYIPLDINGDGIVDQIDTDTGDNGYSDANDTYSDSCSCDSSSSCDSGGGCDSGGSCSCD